MISKGDDYPIHQLPTPISEVGTDRNFYDRYFFNGYNNDASIFFGAAFCVYPNLNIKDGSFIFIHEGVQHNFRYSGFLNQERMETTVGPLNIEIIKPLQQLRIHLKDSDKDIDVDITFTGRFEPMEEPRMTLKNGPRVTMDSTRMTQHGNWSGSIVFQKKKFDLKKEGLVGTRDRSWGIRPVGAADAQMMPSDKLPQFYWLWAPANFTNFSSHLYFVDNEEGITTHSHCVKQEEKISSNFEELSKEIEYKKNSRRISKASFSASKKDGSKISWSLEPKYHIYMCGLGYMHPEWGHGQFKGDNQSHYDSYNLNEDLQDPPFLHIQAICEFHVVEGEQKHNGIGVLEQLIFGPHSPSGFKGLLDT